MQPQTVALSLKQPWAALLVHGLKKIEVRRWSTKRRGHVLIHAARNPDRRAEAWAHVPPELTETARLGGGIVGMAELAGCVCYRSVEEFTADRPLHLNDPAWFQGPCMYGFTFARTTPVPFRRFPGNLHFFPVEVEVPLPKSPAE